MTWAKNHVDGRSGTGGSQRDPDGNLAPVDMPEAVRLDSYGLPYGYEEVRALNSFDYGILGPEL